MDFTPFSVDICGFLDQDAAELVYRFAHRIGERNGRGYWDALRCCRRKLSVAIQAAVSRQLTPLFSLQRKLRADDVDASLLDGGG